MSSNPIMSTINYAFLFHYMSIYMNTQWIYYDSWSYYVDVREVSISLLPVPPASFLRIREQSSKPASQAISTSFWTEKPQQVTILKRAGNFRRYCHHPTIAKYSKETAYHIPNIVAHACILPLYKITLTVSNCISDKKNPVWIWLCSLDFIKVGFWHVVSLVKQKLFTLLMWLRFA